MPRKPPAAPSRGVPRKSATVLPFPAARQVFVVRRHAAAMTASAPTPAADYFKFHKMKRWQTLAGLGVAPHQIEADIAALESAVNVEIWRTIILGEERG